MLIVLNGSFGVGKTTVATLLQQRLPGSLIYDPEWIGFVLRRLPKWIKLTGSGTDDYQDIVLWRQSVPWGVRLFRVAKAGPIIIPMAFSHRAYFAEVMRGLQAIDPALRVFCLRASLDTIKLRLTKRGERLDEPSGAWLAKRIIECEEAHRDPYFGEPIDTEQLTAPEVAHDILTRVQ